MQDSKELQEILKKYEEQTKSGNTLTPEEACAAKTSGWEAAPEDRDQVARSSGLLW